MGEFDYTKGVYSSCNTVIKSDDIASVERFSIKVEEVELYVVGVQLVKGKWHFECNSQEAYLGLERKIAEKNESIKELLWSITTKWGAMRFFLKKAVFNTCHDYGLDYHSYLRSMWKNYDDFYIYEFKANDILTFLCGENQDELFMDKLYEKFLLLMPQNLEKGEEREIKERIARDKEYILREYGEDFQKKEEALYKSIERYEENYKTDGLKELAKGILEEIAFWQKVVERKYDTSEICVTYLDILKEEARVIKGKYYEYLETSLENRYGEIERNKYELLRDLKNISFEDGVNLFKLYQANYRELKNQFDESPFNNIDSPYNVYMIFFEMGSVQISNTLNKINKYKSKRKMISQENLDRALLYFYNADTVAEAQSNQEKQDYLENKKSGTIGEREVEYALKWLDKSYIIVERNSIGKYGEKAVILNNPEFIDEPQEYDHLIIGKQGVFLVETKNYAGKVIVDLQGNWIRVRKDGQEEGERNPLQQIRRHEKLLRSFIKKDIPIISIICMAHAKMIIEGAENCRVPIIKSDLLTEFIENYNSNRVLSAEEVQECLIEIENHMI